jgi:hypothetical protein
LRGASSFPDFLGDGHQHADPPHSFGLLRTRGERQGRRRAATDQRDELAPSHETNVT